MRIEPIQRLLLDNWYLTILRTRRQGTAIPAGMKGLVTLNYDELVNVSSFPYRSGTISPTLEGWKAWLPWAGKPEPKTLTELTRQSAPPPMSYNTF